MATYKVIQDIEAEDKFLGPLTLKQFIFGAIAGLFGYLSFFAVTKGVYFLLAVFMPPALLGAFLAIPWSSDQPTEVWVLAKLRFKLKPQTRIWDQAGLEELVTINVPKKIEKKLTNGLNQTEVQSRLKALAETIDTRGWATKNATLTDSYMPNYIQSSQQVSERLINPLAFPQAVPDVDTSGYTDVLAEDAFVSSNFETMIQASTQQRNQQALERMDRIRHGEPVNAVAEPQARFTPPPVEQYAQQQPMPPQPQMYQQPYPQQQQAAPVYQQPQSMMQPQYPQAQQPYQPPVQQNYQQAMPTYQPPTPPPMPIQATPAMSEDEITRQLLSNRANDGLANSHMRRLPIHPGAPPAQQPDPAVLPTPDPAVASSTDDDLTDTDEAQAEMTSTPNPAILDLAQNNDLNIATLARQAQRNQPKDDEVVVSLR